MDDEPGQPYVARFGFSPAQVALALLPLGLSGWLVWVMVDIGRRPPTGDPTEDAWLAAMMVLWGALAILLGGAAVSWLVAMATRRVALRLDAHGVTLGRPPFPPTHLVTVPWHDVEDVVLFLQTRYIAGRTVYVSFVGLRLTAEAVRPPGVPAPGTLRAWFNRGYPAEVSQAVLGWDLDDAQLARVIRHFAPHVALTYA